MVRSLFGEGPKSFGGGEDECEEEEDMLKQGGAKQREKPCIWLKHIFMFGVGNPKPKMNLFQNPKMK